MSNICSLSMDNTHNNVEFGVFQKTSKQSLISIFFYIGRGDTPLPYPHSCIWCFCFTVDTLCSGLFEIWRFSVQRIYSGFNVILAGILLTETSDYFSKIIWSSYRLCSQIWHFCVTYVEFPVIFSNRDGCHMCGRKCSVFLEHLISLPFGEFMISPIHHIYIIYHMTKSYRNSLH